jgi:hypothetical protein
LFALVQIVCMGFELSMLGEGAGSPHTKGKCQGVLAGPSSSMCLCGYSLPSVCRSVLCHSLPRCGGVRFSFLLLMSAPAPAPAGKQKHDGNPLASHILYFQDPIFVLCPCPQGSPEFLVGGVTACCLHRHTSCKFRTLRSRSSICKSFVYFLL